MPNRRAISGGGRILSGRCSNTGGGGRIPARSRARL